MSKMSIFLMVVMLASMAVWLVPGILAMNRGRILRNTALWLAIFTGLTLIYKNFGPESEHPLFAGPGAPAENRSENTKTDSPRPDDRKDGSQNFTPPEE